MTHILDPKLKAASDVLGIEFVMLMVEDFVIGHMKIFILHIVDDIGGCFAVHTSPISVLSNQ
jgi:hypothetical protein